MCQAERYCILVVFLLCKTICIMSAFDYPRLMLTGRAVCSPATGNNCRFAPLSIFDPVSGTCVIPPRLFLDKKKTEIIKECKLKGFELKKATIDGKKYTYIEIAPTILNDRQKFKEWARHPLGEYDGDKDYRELYGMIELTFGGGPLLGNKPGYFNYYGTTEFDFRDVKVHSIALHATKDGESILKEKDKDTPENLVKLFQSELKINDGLTSKAKMVDSASSVSLATQIFWDKLTLNMSSEVLFSGKPCKASLRFASASRIPELKRTGGPHCASGTFFSTIRIEDIEEGHNAEVIKLLFEKYKIRKNEELIGLQIVFNLFEVKEQVDTVKDMKNPPVETTVMVAITPWYKGDLKSISMGRQLNAGINYLKKCKKKSDPRIKDFLQSPVVAQVDYEQQYLMLDLINNIPEKHIPPKGVPIPEKYVPIPGDKSTYETMDIGILICQLYKSKKVLGKIRLNPTDFSRTRYLETSGKVVFYNDRKFEPIEYKDALTNDRIALYLCDSEGRNLIGDTKDDYVMLESEYMIATDQGSLYASMHDDPAHGYRSYSGEKEHCKINVYKRGFECREPIPITILQCEVKPWNLQIVLSNHRILHYKNGDIVSFPTEKAFNGLYLFYANIDAPIVRRLKTLYGGWLWYFVNTYFNSYVGVRILPHQNYSKYLDLHKSGREEVTFEVLKKEVFDRYDLLYPFMSGLFPFEEELFRNNQDHIYQLMSFDNWENSTYMPVSRDLSPQQLRLFLEWMQIGKGAFYHSADVGPRGERFSPPTDDERFIPR